MVDVMSELLWDHIQSRKASLIKICRKHTYSDYEDDVSMYTDFISHFIYWFTHEYTMVNNQGRSEWNKEIPMKMNTHCDCTLLITPMDLFDICIIPAIQQIMFIVYGAITNTHIFGDTRIQHIILMGSIMNIKCKTTHTETLYLLKDCIEKQNKYYNHITIHWSEEQVSKMVYQGIQSIKRNPSGGLLEQIIGGTYTLEFDKAVYLDFQKLKLLDAGDLLALINNPTVVTEDMRETGRSFYYYYEGENIALYLSYSTNKQEKPTTINDYEITNIDSFPITVKWKIGLREVIFRFGAGAEGNADIMGANNDKFCMRENMMLSPYV
ncbi:hypothetical protein BDB01DRAFT_482484 [Pilobolus umbonatus]|nr:hypothetical protein BDB01DRAFT_482484 [Pilobolus umbonatus]